MEGRTRMFGDDMEWKNNEIFVKGSGKLWDIMWERSRLTCEGLFVLEKHLNIIISIAFFFATV